MAAGTRVVVFVTFLAMTMGLGLYVTVRSMAPRATDSVAARKRVALVAALSVLFVALTEAVARRYAPMGGGWFRPFVWAARVGSFTLFVSLLGTVAVQLASQAFLRERKAAEPAPEADALTRREAVARALTGAVVGASSAGVLFGSLRERHDLQVTDVTVVIPDLPPSLDGMTIVQLTDLHVGIFTGKTELDHLIARANALRGDLVVLTGDVIDANPRHIADGMRELARLRGRLGVYAVLGNHDHFTGAAKVLRGFAGVGIAALVNRAVRVHTGDPRRGFLTLAGVDDVTAAIQSSTVGPDLPQALRGKPRSAPSVLLAHNPVFFEEAAGEVALQLSGHTHGGQINVGGVAGAVLPYVAGRYEREGSSLFVSRGVGITGPPVRLAAAPEIVRVALTSRRG